MKKANLKSSSRSVSVRDISCCAIPRTKTLRGDGIGAQAFTLIELLVVVLIIGILAAIALPQYRVAVAKARLAAAIPAVASMKQAAEAYYMANNEYVNDISAYDIAYPICNTALTTGHCRRADGTWFDVATGSGACTWDVAGIIMNGDDAINSYGICLDHSNHPGKVYCGAAKNNSVANQVCQSMGGTFNRLGKCISTANKTPCNIYLLP